MEVTIKVSNWIGENLKIYLKDIGFEIRSHDYVVDPGGDGNDYIYAVMPEGWTRTLLRQRLMNCGIPQSMFVIS